MLQSVEEESDLFSSDPFSSSEEWEDEPCPYDDYSDEDLKLPPGERISNPELNYATLRSAWHAEHKGHRPLTRLEKRALELARDEKTLRREIMLPRMYDSGAPLRRDDRVLLKKPLATEMRRILERDRRQEAMLEEFYRLTLIYRSEVAKELTALGVQGYEGLIDWSYVPPAISDKTLVCHKCKLPGHMTTNMICPLAFSDQTRK